ncbi:alpha-2-macroglobulin-like [Leptodactylus fuscus]|uniref:alpha-2-macroglobulin-like n=1 Tax=Leptodactylus fuscus TaxID=238119 RepID=UPI003F4EC42A
MWLLLVSTCLAIFSPSLTSASKPHYAITVPYTLAQGANEKACVTFLDLKGTVDLKLELDIDDQVYTIGEHKIDAHDHSECYPFQVPVLKKGYSEGSVHVTAHGDHINVDESQKVSIIQQNMCIIQTDKFIYKPGDTVTFQLISMDRNYHSTDNTHPLVEIIDPNKYHIAQWRDVSTKNGFAELTFHLADELPLGEYQISLPDLCKKKFKVEEYVVQRFEIIFNVPTNVALTEKTLHLEACGRYTYGKPVEGSLDLSISAKQYYYRVRWDSDDEEDEEKKFIKIKNVKTDSKGCISKDIDLEYFDLPKTEVYQVLLIKSWLTEDQTGHTEKAGVLVSLDVHESIRFIDELLFYQKGLPYHNKVQVTGPKGQPIPNKPVYLYLMENYLENSKEPIENLTTDENGIVHCNLNTSTWTSFMTLKATLEPEEHYTSNVVTYARLGPMYTQSESQLAIRSKSIELKCDSDETVTVEYNINRKTLDSDTDHLHFFYMIRSKTGISLYKELKIDIKDQSNNPMIHGSFPVSFHIDADLFPIAVLIVFSLLPNGETIASLAPYEVPLCAQEKVELKFSEEQVRPGASVNLDVSASAGSLCSIRSLDKGHLLRMPGVNSLFSDLREELSDFTMGQLRLFRRVVEESERNQCPENETPVTETFPRIVDVSMIFMGCGLNIFTNTEIKKPVTCVKPELSARSGVKVKKPGDKAKKSYSPYTRTEFPDRWIFDLVPIGPEGHTVLNLTTPDSTTKWVTDAFCLGKTGFASVSDVELTTFQPYFIDLIAPYSVVQGEKFTIQAVVFNYATKCILIYVYLVPSEDLEKFRGRLQSKCVCEGHAHSFTWDLTAVKPKTLQIHVDSGAAEMEGDCTEDLGIENKIMKDSIEKSIIVKPMGHQEEKTQTFLIYPGSSQEEIHITLRHPERIIPESERAQVFIVGDMMATVAQNIENIVLLPDGCGEQKASKFLRYCYTLEYLDTVHELKPEEKAKIINEMQKGYQNLLTFRDQSGSFSIFPGEQPNSWLTALTVNAFTALQNWIPIDKKYIQEAVDWLQTVQSSDGCFRDGSSYFNNELEADNEVAQTAFVVISLLENQKEYNASMVENALGCLRRSVDTVTAVHTQALLAYALALSGDHELRDRVLKKLDEKAIKKAASKHWETSPNCPDDVETSSYILLSLISDKTTASKHVEECAEVVRWIAGQQNSHGGFQSSQDTTVGLQALTKFAKLINYKKGDSTVTIRSKSGFKKTFDVHRSNSLFVHKVDLTEIPGEYDITVKGDGIVYIQSQLRYNIYPESDTGHFSLNVTTEPSVCTQESRRKFDVHIDVRYSGKREETNMVVILIEPVSGFVPDKTSIKKLEENPEVSKTEISAKKITLYLNKLAHERKSFQFSLEKETNVENLQPATVVISDYYHPDVHTVIEYNAPCHGGHQKIEQH